MERLRVTYYFGKIGVASVKIAVRGQLAGLKLERRVRFTNRG